LKKKLVFLTSDSASLYSLATPRLLSAFVSDLPIKNSIDR